PLVVVNSLMVRNHFQHYYGFTADEVHVVRSAIDPDRFAEHDRPKRRLEYRGRWGLGAEATVALFAAMNYRLKGLEPLLHAVARLADRPEGRAAARPFRLLVAGNPDSRRYERMARRLGVGARVRF